MRDSLDSTPGPAGCRHRNAFYRLQWIQLRGEQREWTGPFAVYHSIRGWALKPNIRARLLRDGAQYQFLRHSGASEYAHERTPGMQRIVFFGVYYTSTRRDDPRRRTSWNVVAEVALELG